MESDGLTNCFVIRNPWNTQRMMVTYRVYCPIFCLPPSSFDSLPTCGITAVSNCIMMLALMYGITPSENSAHCSSAPPLKILNSAAAPPPSPLLFIRSTK